MKSQDRKEYFQTFQTVFVHFKLKTNQFHPRCQNSEVFSNDSINHDWKNYDKMGEKLASLQLLVIIW